ncbi:hypothetical protein [Pseudacidovorax intermedius]|uniref:hypothetical protein n=1 Tax=Pseudacidovorax intermedius TaxID=433924 RepID=UPI0026EA05D4|nr:hypothetical protein [Pseudacidovorax intermedius]
MTVEELAAKHKAEMNALIAYITGLQLGVAHIALVLDAKGVVGQAELVNSLQLTAAGIGPDVRNGPIVAKAVNDLAGAVKNARPGSGPNLDQLH